MRPDYKPTKQFNAVSFLRTLPEDLQRDIIIKADKYRDRVRATGHKFTRLDALSVVLSILNYDAGWINPKQNAKKEG